MRRRRIATNLSPELRQRLCRAASVCKLTYACLVHLSFMHWLHADHSDEEFARCLHRDDEDKPKTVLLLAMLPSEVVAAVEDASERWGVRKSILTRIALRAALDRGAVTLPLEENREWNQ